MTKIKNTKKGMAKKTLSMSLVVAMLATSNVPVWAAEFSDGTDAAVATEASAAEAFSDETAEAPVVDDTTDAAPASIKVNEADMSLDLSAEKDSITWAEDNKGNATATDKITGTITKKDGTAVSEWLYRWVDESGIVVQSSRSVDNKDVRIKNVEDMTLKAGHEMAGKKLTLYVYDYDSTGNQTIYDLSLIHISEPTRH